MSDPVNARFHEAAKIFPMMAPDELERLAEDIKANGQKVPIVRVNGLILDGRNRYMACRKAGVEPKFIDHDGADPWRTVWSLNKERRHITDAIRMAAIAKDMLAGSEKWQAEREAAREAANKARGELANEHRGEGGKFTARASREAPTVVDYSKKNERKEASKVAEFAGVSRASVERATELQNKDPEAYEKVKSGEAKGGLALRQAQRRVAATAIRSEPEPLPTGPFRVVVADPPWAYEKRADDETHRGALSYPSMTTEEICKMPVNGLFADDSILWMWTTNAFLHDAFHVIEAWGLEPKTVLTWAKNKMGLGDWLRGKTEHCILAIKGKPVVEMTNQTTLLMADVREHSRKPDEFFAMVETLCPGSKLEMFAREQREGWQSWGCEKEKFSA